MSKGLFLPQDFALAIQNLKKYNNPYLMSARHRGDMYQLRGAMAIFPRGIILYESDPAVNGSVTKDVEDYLSMSAQTLGCPILIVTWSRETFTNGQDIDALSYNRCTLNGRALTAKDKPVLTKPCTFLTEGDSTMQIAALATVGNMPSVIDHMALPGKTAEKILLDKAFLELAPTIFKTFKKGTKYVLILYRDTGAGGGAYPELDSGHAIEDFVSLVSKLSTEKCPLSPLLAGNKPDGKVPSIGEYWMDLRPLVAKSGMPKRDVEAYFMHWAFDNGYFHMVLGFRSGVLDSFTLMGVPTVSVGLRFLAGEERHLCLAKELLKRVNVAYDQPRHNTTAWVKSRKADQFLLQSPFWLEAAPGGVTAREVPGSQGLKDALLKTPPGHFIGFDNIVIAMALGFACEKMLGMERTTMSLAAETRAINAPVTRSMFPSQAKSDGLNEYLAWFDRRKTDDTETISDRAEKSRREALQEREQEYLRYKTESINGWQSIKSGFQRDD